MTRWVVSVEGLSVPARAAVLKSLHHRFGLALADAERPETHPFEWLLHRMRGLAKAPADQDVLWAGSWLMHVPQGDALLARLFTAMATALAERLPHPAHTRHLMVWLDADPHEAFEAMIGAGAEAGPVTTRDVSLQCLRNAQASINRAAQLAREGCAAQLCSPFDVQIVRVACPPYAADNPVAMAGVLDLVEDECLKAMRE